MGAWGMRLRVWASVALLVLFPVVLMAVLVLILVLFVIGIKYAGQLGGKVIVLAFPLVAAVFATGRELLRLRRLPPAPGLEISPQQEPRLWAEIRAVAEAMDEDPPDRVVLFGRVTAAVTEASGRRELLIGLPLLIGLTRAELRAVIAHEMGHLAHGHTRGSTFVHRAHYFLQATLDNHDPGLVRRLLVVYLKLYERVSASVRREKERQADQWAARLAGPEAMAAALSRLHFLSLAWGQVLGSYGQAMVNGGPRGSLSEAFSGVIRHSGPALEEEVRRHPRPTSPYDSHPPVPERIELLRRLPVPDPRSAPYLEYPDEPAWSWLMQPGQRLTEVEATQIAPGPSPAVSDWSSVLTRRMLQTHDESAALLMGALQQLDRDAPPTLDSVLRVMAAGHGERLAAPLLRGDTPREQRSAQSRQVLGHTLLGAIITLLGQERRVAALPDFSPQGPFRIDYRHPDGHSFEPPLDEVLDDPLNDALEDPRAVGHLADVLIWAGLDLHRPVAPPDRPGGALLAGAVALAKITVKGPARHHLRPRGAQDVLVFDEGILAGRTPPEGRMNPWRALKWVFTPRSHHHDRALHRIQAFADQVGAHPQAWALANGGTWLTFRQISEVKHRDALVSEGQVMKLTLKDGSRVQIETTNAGLWIDDVPRVVAAAIS
ncbi:M48 family metallopeptidase [Kineosporia rhizophila]|uniref:M48 family metalloprotease n=1 Tax=Kineosporia rhizophila TaxID=84633 RepID=UPI001E43B863|nr:M48 family metallopeptidase [Kineosporia rhizophila]